MGATTYQRQSKGSRSTIKILSFWNENLRPTVVFVIKAPFKFIKAMTHFMLADPSPRQQIEKPQQFEHWLGR